jgi:hypothetical protein
MQNTYFFTVSALDFDDIDMCQAGTVVQRSEGSVMLAEILGPSEHGADWSITCERFGTVVTDNCAPVARMSLLCVRTNNPMANPVVISDGTAPGSYGTSHFTGPQL